MNLDSKTKARIGIVSGLALGMVTYVLSFGGDSMFIFGVVVFLVASLFSIWGCTHYALSKGLPDWLGYAGMLSLFGFLLIYILPDRSRGHR